MKPFKWFGYVDILVRFSGSIGWESLDLKDSLEENVNVDSFTVDALELQLKDIIYQ